jgi:hypothetical protein
MTINLVALFHVDLSPAYLAITIRPLVNPTADGAQGCHAHPDLRRVTLQPIRIPPAATTNEFMASGMMAHRRCPSAERTNLPAGLAYLGTVDADTHPLVLYALGTELNDRAGILGPILL